MGDCMHKNIHEIVNYLDYDSRLISKVKSINFNKVILENPYLNLDPLRKENDYGRFVLSLYAILFSYKEYTRLKIPFHIFKQTMEDFNLRSIKYFEENKDWGIKSDDLKWLHLLFNLKIFKLNSLRFQIFPMDYKEMEREGEDFLPLSKEIKTRFPKDYPLINTHIESKADLSDNSVEKSFILAQSFFNEFFPDFQAQGFITRTWLLHPSLKKLLPSQSKILRFANRFEIIGLSNNYSQALVRIYGTSDLKQIKKVKNTTTLQKNAIAIYQDLGVGIGFLKMEALSHD